MAKNTLTVYIPPDLKRQAKVKALLADTSVSAVVRKFLQEWVEEGQEEEKDKLV